MISHEILRHVTNGTIDKCDAIMRDEDGGLLLRFDRMDVSQDEEGLTTLQFYWRDVETVTKIIGTTIDFQNGDTVSAMGIIGVAQLKLESS
jgi:hypothetical protein